MGLVKVPDIINGSRISASSLLRHRKLRGAGRTVGADPHAVSTQRDEDSTKIEPCHRGPLQGFLGDSPEFVPKGSVSVGELCLVVFIDTEITADDLRFGDLSKYLRV